MWWAMIQNNNGEQCIKKAKKNSFFHKFNILDTIVYYNSTVLYNTSILQHSNLKVVLQSSYFGFVLSQ